MPRVNRDLQRRMAARRERERRRPPGERRYRVESPEAIDPLAEPDGELFDSAPEMLPETASRSARSVAAPRAASVPRTTPRAAPKPFSAYREEYAYVGADLRRIVLVIGSLLVVLIVLHFVLVR